MMQMYLLAMFSPKKHEQILKLVGKIVYCEMLLK